MSFDRIPLPTIPEEPETSLANSSNSYGTAASSSAAIITAAIVSASSSSTAEVIDTAQEKQKIGEEFYRQGVKNEEKKDVAQAVSDYSQGAELGDKGCWDALERLAFAYQHEEDPDESEDKKEDRPAILDNPAKDALVQLAEKHEKACEVLQKMQRPRYSHIESNPVVE